MFGRISLFNIYRYTPCVVRRYYFYIVVYGNSVFSILPPAVLFDIFGITFQKSVVVYRDI